MVIIQCVQQWLYWCSANAMWKMSVVLYSMGCEGNLSGVGEPLSLHPPIFSTTQSSELTVTNCDFIQCNGRKSCSAGNVCSLVVWPSTKARRYVGSTPSAGRLIVERFFSARATESLVRGGWWVLSKALGVRKVLALHPTWVSCLCALTLSWGQSS
jgi:hypothetical protein